MIVFSLEWIGTNVLPSHSNNIGAPLGAKHAREANLAEISHDSSMPFKMQKIHG
jgi:hypothetical protein